MKKQNPLPMAAFVMVLVFTLINSITFAKDCSKAQDLYDQASASSDYEQRRKGFEKAVSLCPGFAEAHVNLADAYENLALQSKSFNKSNLHKNNELIDRAIKEYKAAIKLNPNIFEAYLGLAENYFRIGLYARSISAYEKALEVNPNHSLTGRAKSGLRSVKQAAQADQDGFREAGAIVKEVSKSLSNKRVKRIMGFKGSTFTLARQRFNNILFNTMSHSLDRKEAIEQLEEIGKALSSESLANYKFIVEGHTDSRGGKEMNQRLSERRADAVRKYLTEKHGIDKSRITSQGFGYKRPRAPNDSADNMLKNRRVELIIIQ